MSREPMRSRLRTVNRISAGLILATQAAAQVTLYEGEEFRGAFRVDTTIQNFALWDSTTARPRRSSSRDAGKCARTRDFAAAARFWAPATIHRWPRWVSTTAFLRRGPSSGKRNIRSRRHRRPRRRTIIAGARTSICSRFRCIPFARWSVRRSSAAGSSASRSSSPAVAPNVPGAVIGAIIGGVLGHQVGGGRGQDVATAGGAVAGAAIGANVGRSPGGVYSQDVQRCAVVPGSARPDYWDVMYYFDGLEHHMQLSAPPPPTIWVNGNGEPRM